MGEVQVQVQPRFLGGFDLNSGNKGCARLGGEVARPLGAVKEEVAVLVRRWLFFALLDKPVSSWYLIYVCLCPS